MRQEGLVPIMVESLELGLWFKTIGPSTWNRHYFTALFLSTFPSLPLLADILFFTYKKITSPHLPFPQLFVVKQHAALAANRPTVSDPYMVRPLPKTALNSSWELNTITSDFFHLERKRLARSGQVVYGSNPAISVASLYMEQAVRFDFSWKHLLWLLIVLLSYRWFI